MEIVWVHDARLEHWTERSEKTKVVEGKRDESPSGMLVSMILIKPCLGIKSPSYLVSRLLRVLHRCRKYLYVVLSGYT